MNFEPKEKDKDLNFRLMEGMDPLIQLYQNIYHTHPKADQTFEKLIETLIDFAQKREPELKKRDAAKKQNWFLSNELAGMSLYVDRFCENLKNLKSKLGYFDELGVNFLHLMPLFESPAGESDGGYAVSNFRKVDAKFGSLKDLIALRKAMQNKTCILCWTLS